MPRSFRSATGIKLAFVIRPRNLGRQAGHKFPLEEADAVHTN